MSRPIIAGIRSRSPEDDPGAELREQFRDAMSRWPSGVAVVAVRDEDEVVGLTVSAFTSASLDPPLALVCIGRNAAILPYLEEVRRFTVNVLPDGARAIASRFSQQMPEDPSLFTSGDPLLHGSVTSIVCSVAAVHPAGDHRIFVGAVERVEPGLDESPLVHHRREYRSLS